MARELLANGRANTGALVMRYLAQQMAAGRLRQVEPALAFETFLGLLIGDLQIRLLLGVQAAPASGALRQRAQGATAQFMLLYGVKSNAS